MTNDQKFEKIDPALKDEWLTALRSGDYGQGEGYLRVTDDAYCCLGVLCVLRAKKGHGSWVMVDWAYRARWKFEFEDVSDVSLLPTVVSEELGLPESLQDFLAELNDMRKWDFTRIADWIEENL